MATGCQLGLQVLQRPMLSFRKICGIFLSPSSKLQASCECQHHFHCLSGRKQLNINVFKEPKLWSSLSRQIQMFMQSYTSLTPKVMLSLKLSVHGGRQALPVCKTQASLHDSSFEKMAKTPEELITFIETKEDFEIFLCQVQSALNLVESSKAHATSVRNLRPLVQKLVQLDCDCRGIIETLKANHGILLVKVDRLLGNVDYISMLGLNWRRLLKILNGNDRFWKTSLQQLQKRVKQLRKLGFVEGQLQKVIADCPSILTVGDSELNAMVKVLMEDCQFPKAEVVTILAESPTILQESLESIELRFQYVYYRMGIQNHSEMTQAKLFKYSLDHLRCRHLVLERLGLYAAPDNRGSFALKNPKLARIIDSSDNRFVEKVAQISMNDYRTFAKVILEEIEAEQQKMNLKEGDPDEFSDGENYFDEDSEAELPYFEEEEFDFEKVDYRKKR